MAHQDAPLAQSGGQRGRVVLRMAHEQEVGGGRQHLEAEAGQFAGQPFAAGHHPAPGLVEPLAVAHRGGGAHQRQPVQRIGVETVLHPAQAFDQRRLADREADPQAGQRARLRQRLRHQHIRVGVDQRDRRLAAEIDVGFIDHHRRIRQRRGQACDVGQRQQAAGGCVRIGEDDRAGLALDVVIDTDGKPVVQRHAFEGDAVQPAIDRVEAVGDVREQQRPPVFQQADEGVGQYLVRTVADEHPVGRNAEMVGHRFAQHQPGRVRIELEPVAIHAQFGLHGRHRMRAGRVGVLVGVQLDQTVDLRLLARRVRREGVDDGAPELAHGGAGRRTGLIR